jgi:hypothetical protein
VFRLQLVLCGGDFEDCEVSCAIVLVNLRQFVSSVRLLCNRKARESRLSSNARDRGATQQVGRPEKVLYAPALW